MTIKVARPWIAKSRLAAVLTACAGTLGGQAAITGVDLFSADQGQGISRQPAAAAQRRLPILHDQFIEADVGRRVKQLAVAAPEKFELARLDVRGPELGIALIKLEPFVVEEFVVALPFPVRGLQHNVVGSSFGAPRDAGTRHHEGVDILAPRMTPVVAVANGRATPRTSELGGNTVWLSTPGISYYYAHLERAAVKPGQRVRKGEVLGYVGNSGNALATPPHLHFGIYRWDEGAVDPLPRLAAGRFETPAEIAVAPHAVGAPSGSPRLPNAPSLESPPCQVDWIRTGYQGFLAPIEPMNGECEWRVAGPIELPADSPVPLELVAAGIILELRPADADAPWACGPTCDPTDLVQLRPPARPSRRTVF